MIESKTPNDTNDNYVKPLWNAIVHNPKMYVVIVQPNFLHHDQHFGYFLNGNFPVKHILIPDFSLCRTSMLLVDRPTLYP